MNARLLSTKALCAYLGVGRATFYRQVLPKYHKQLVPVDFCGIKRYVRDDADRIIEQLRGGK